MENLELKSIVQGELEMNTQVEEGMFLGVGGHFEYELVRGGVVVDKWSGKNIVTNEGRVYLLNQVFGAAAKITTWYTGLYTATAGALADLTGAMIGGANLSEFTAYTGNRQEYDGAYSAYTWTNTAAKASFPITSPGVIKGAFLSSLATAAGGTLLCIDAFAAGDRSVSGGDTLNVTYVFGMQNI